VSDRRLIPISSPIHGVLRPPGSKSITNRALVCAALARGRSRLRGALASDDTQVMIEALRVLAGPAIVERLGDDILVVGTEGRFANASAELWVGNSGTTVRFLTAMLAVSQGEFRLDGVARMRQRPIGDLLRALRQLGATVECEHQNDAPPVLVHAQGLAGGRASVRGSISSQYLSGLLLAAPYARSEVRLEIEGELVSRPYVEMTVAVMRAFGVAVESANPSSFRIPAPRCYQSVEYAIEPDASAASYFWAAAAITGGSMKIAGLNRKSLQGDVAFVDCLRDMGCSVDDSDSGITVTGGKLRGVDLNMNAISDTVQTLAAVALFADGPTTIRGVGHIRHKETDRIGDLARELRRLGANVVEHEDGLTIVPGLLRGAELQTYDDHRMAMSLALVGLRIPNVVIVNPDCTQKTYPGFFSDLESVVATGKS